MKLNPAEKAVLILTAVTLAFTAGYFSGACRGGAVLTETAPTISVSASAEVETAGSETAASALVNVNTADAETLSELPGIGEEIAGRIVAYRQEHGPFSTVEELDAVEGIGEKKLEAIRNLITVGENEDADTGR